MNRFHVHLNVAYLYLTDRRRSRTCCTSTRSMVAGITRQLPTARRW